MTYSNKVGVSRFGIILVVVGAILLLDRFQVIDVDFGTVFWPLVMLFGLMGVARGFSQNRRGKIFWGTLWFLYALFFLLRSSDFVEVEGHMFFPASFLIIGIAFLMMYLNNFQDWFFLIPAGVFGGLGALFILANYDVISYWDLRESVHQYWPLALILFGFAIIMRRRNHSGPTVPPPSANNVVS